MPTWFLLFCLLTVCREIVVPVSSTHLRSLDVAHEWKYIDYDFNSDEHRQGAIKSGDYDCRNCVPRDMDRWNDMTFVTVMNGHGVPATLTVVTNKTGPGGPLLRPYPDWTWANNINCSGITSAYEIEIDMCDRLWVVDAGLFDDIPICPPRLFIFDLHTSNLLNKIEIPKSIATSGAATHGWLTHIVVKTSGLDCANTTAYISDTMGAGLIVYNGELMRRLNSWDLKCEADAVNGACQMECGIAAMALSSLTQNLYFTALFSRGLGIANTDRSDERSSYSDLEFHEYENVFTTESTALAVSRTGAVFFGLADDSSIACWSEYRRFERDNIEVISRDCAALQFISSMKVKHFYPDEQLWVLSSRYEKDVAGGYNFTEINFRILRRDVNDLIRDTHCTPDFIGPRCI